MELPVPLDHMVYKDPQVKTVNLVQLVPKVPVVLQVYLERLVKMATQANPEDLANVELLVLKVLVAFLELLVSQVRKDTGVTLV